MDEHMNPMADGGILGNLNVSEQFRMLRWNLWSEGHNLEEELEEDDEQLHSRN